MKKQKYSIGVDIGGTKICTALIDEKGRIIESVRTKTCPEKGKKYIINSIIDSIRTILENTDIKPCGVGIGFPGCADENGKVIFGGSSLQILIGTNIAKEIQKEINLPVKVENDANCFALAEWMFGAGKGHKLALGIIWGTGVGAGIIIDGKVLRGRDDGAGEFGHIIIDKNIKTGKICNCGQRGCVDNLSSGKNIIRIYRESGGKIKDPNPGDLYNSKEKIARVVMENAIDNFSYGLTNIINTINPDIIVIGGGVSNLPDKAYDDIRKKVKKYAIPMFTKDLKIVRYKISDDAGVIGAAALMF